MARAGFCRSCAYHGASKLYLRSDGGHYPVWRRRPDRHDPARAASLWAAALFDVLGHRGRALAALGRAQVVPTAHHRGMVARRRRPRAPARDSFARFGGSTERSPVWRSSPGPQREKRSTPTQELVEDRWPATVGAAHGLWLRLKIVLGRGLAKSRRRHSRVFPHSMPTLIPLTLLGIGSMGTAHGHAWGTFDPCCG